MFVDFQYSTGSLGYDFMGNLFIALKCKTLYNIQR